MQGVTAFEYFDVVSETNKSHTHLKQLVKHNVEETKNSPLRFLYLLYFTRFRLELSKCGDVGGGCEKSCGKSFLQPFLSFFLLRLLNIIPREKKHAGLLHFINWALAIFYITIFRLQVATIIQRWLWGCRITSFTINFLVYQFTLLTVFAAFRETLYRLVIAV